jgi:hypothetical protein
LMEGPLRQSRCRQASPKTSLIGPEGRERLVLKKWAKNLVNQWISDWIHSK